MTNPVLVEVTRGALVESIHRGAVAVSDAAGNLRVATGDTASPVYPRSALKPIQALPLVESGAADAFALTTEEIALACASHSGEPMHTERVALWLERLHCCETDLACGPHELRHEPTGAAMRARGERPTALHNNCSGKHTGFLTLARHLGAPVADYVAIAHSVQRSVAATLADLAALPGEIPWGVDGCTAPNFAVSLAALARALAQLADPARLAPARAGAARRIMAAMTAHPELVAGSGRACTRLMLQSGGKLAVKTGAEGVYVAILPELGMAAALKIDDGATRASETAIAGLLIALGVLSDDGAAHALAYAPVRDTRGNVVGLRRPSQELMGIRLG